MYNFNSEYIAACVNRITKVPFEARIAIPFTMVCNTRNKRGHCQSSVISRRKEADNPISFDQLASTCEIAKAIDRSFCMFYHNHPPFLSSTLVHGAGKATVDTVPSAYAAELD